MFASLNRSGPLRHLFLSHRTLPSMRQEPVKGAHAARIATVTRNQVPSP